jgi:hypothetical protein
MGTPDPPGRPIISDDKATKSARWQYSLLLFLKNNTPESANPPVLRPFHARFSSLRKNSQKFFDTLHPVQPVVA